MHDNGILDSFGSVPAPALERLIYIVGSARGGTSVFMDAMDAHDRILMLPGMTHFLNQVWRYRKRVHQRLLRQIFRLPSFFRVERVVKNMPQDRTVELYRYIDRVLLSADLRLMWQLYPLIYALDPDNQKNPKRVLAWGDKANDVFGLDDAAKAFPEGKFILLFRDPRSVSLSQARRVHLMETRERSRTADELKLIEASISWRNMAQRMLALEKRYGEDRALRVKFEDFVGHPEEIMNRVFDFVLGRMMDKEELQNRLSKLSYGTSNDPIENGKGVSSRPLDRWKTLLTESQKGYVAKIAGPTARKLGYDVHSYGKEVSFKQILEHAPNLKKRAVLFVKLAYLAAREASV